jgi:hypothetical protein
MVCTCNNIIKWNDSDLCSKHHMAKITRIFAP